MKGLILTYVIAYTSAFASLRYPVIGLYAYVGFAVLRPQALFGFAGDISNISLVVGSAMLIGWALNGFGSRQLGRGRSIAYVFAAFALWFGLSAMQALNTSVAYDAVYEFSKLALPFVAGVTLLESETDSRRMLWVLVLAQGYVGFEQNLNYLKGFNTASEGFGGMDNNFFGLSLVTLIGPAITLTLAARTTRERVLAAAATALILHTILLTFSRGALMGLLAVFVVAFVMMPKRPLYIGAMVVLLLVAVRFTGPQLAERYGSILASDDKRDASSESRIELWRDCLEVIEQYPVFGVGPANWRVIASTYGWPEGKSAHSVWMESAAEDGIPGALFLLAFFVLAAAKLWPIARARPTPENRYRVAVASGVILSIVGFVVSGQFVSAPALEVPYYVAMLGIALLKSTGAEEVPSTELSWLAGTPVGVGQQGLRGDFYEPTTGLTGAEWRRRATR